MIQLVRVNVHKHKKYIEYYDQQTLDKVNELMKEDFERFQYKMVSTLDELKHLDDENKKIDDENDKLSPNGDNILLPRKKNYY